MPAEAMPWPDRPTRALGRWLAGQATAGVGDRVGPRYGNGVALPQAAVTYVAGPPWAADFQIDVWADTDAAAEAACAQLCAALDGMGGAVQGDVLLSDATVLGMRSFPDDDLARYIADATVTMGAA